MHLRTESGQGHDHDLVIISRKCMMFGDDHPAVHVICTNAHVTMDQDHVTSTHVHVTIIRDHVTITHNHVIIYQDLVRRTRDQDSECKSLFLF